MPRIPRRPSKQLSLSDISKRAIDAISRRSAAPAYEMMTPTAFLARDDVAQTFALIGELATFVDQELRDIRRRIQDLATVAHRPVGADEMVLSAEDAVTEIVRLAVEQDGHPLRAAITSLVWRAR